MDISVVIPTCNRKLRLLSVLRDLDRSLHLPVETIVVDSGEDRLTEADIASFPHLPIRYLPSESSVCIQRNLGIREARCPYVFLCDDDMEIPPGYLANLTAHMNAYPGCGAVSGIWMEKKGAEWVGSHPETSGASLYLKFIFQLSIWGEIVCAGPKNIKQYYLKKENHISKAGWPVLTKFSGAYFTSPVYSLGAALIKKEWLLASPYDEVLDKHGIGDNYGVATGFPGPIHILNDAPVYHHLEPANRLKRVLQYYRRVLAIDYFSRTRPQMTQVKKGWILWSQVGNFIGFLRMGDGKMMKACLKSMVKIAFNQNPYIKAKRHGKKITEPLV